MTRTCSWIRWMPRLGLGSGLACLSLNLQAAPDPEALRDPTQPPAQLRAHDRGVPEGNPSQAAPLPRQLIVVNGHTHLVVGGRRLGVGDKLGEARIVRFEDGAVVLREGGATRRVSLYSGVEKRPVMPPPDASAALPTGPRWANPPARPHATPRANPKVSEQEKP